MTDSHKRQTHSAGRPLRRLALATAVLASLAAGSAHAGPPPVAGVAEVSRPTGFWGNVAWCSRRARLHCRTSALGRFLTNAVRPVSKLTGGLIPVPDDNHFAAAVELHATKPAGMAAGAAPAPPPPPPPGVAAAAQIKLEKKQAKIRREAVAYLAGLDCRYYPEAEAALIASLRADRDECVRLEAARALLSGCCCTPAVAKALTICVTGSEEDGNPAERNGAVRRTALAALQKCQSCVGVSDSPDPTPPEAPLSGLSNKTPVTPVTYDAAYEADYDAASSEPTPRAAPPAEAQRPTSLADLWRAAALSPSE